METNLKLVENRIDENINPNAQVGEILAQKHNETLKEVFKSAGKYVGFNFEATKNSSNIVLPGQLVFGDNPINQTSFFVLKVSNKDKFNLDVGVLLQVLSSSAFLSFKDYEGRATIFEFQSYTSEVDTNGNTYYSITLKSITSNSNYSYQTTDNLDCVLNFFYSKNEYGTTDFKNYANPSTDPTEDGWYFADSNGTYVNFNNEVVDLSNGISILIVSGSQTIFKQIVIPSMSVEDEVVFNSEKLIKSKSVYSFFFKQSLKENWLNSNYYNTTKWIFKSGGSVSDNLITIKANELQAKIQIPSNEIVSGQKYIMLINVEELTALHPNATSLKFYNYSQKLYEHTLSNAKKFISVTFTANNGGQAIQVLVGGNVNSGTPATGTDLISFKSNFVGFIPWTQEKEDLYNIAEIAYTTGNFSTFFALESGKAKVSDYSKQIPSYFKAQHVDQFFPNNWILSSGGSKNEDGEITINKNVQPKIQVPNTTTVGEKYIMFAYIDNVTILDNTAVSLKFYNYGVELFSLALTGAAFNYKVFNSTVDNVIQVLVGGDFTEVDEGTPLCSFTSKAIAVIPWSQDVENLFADVKKNYKGGEINFGRDLYSYIEQNIELPTSSFNTLKDLSSRVKADYATDIPAWNSTPNATNVTNEVVNQEINGESVPVWRVGGTLDLTTYPSGRLWYGFDIRPENYATEDKTYVVVIEGKVTATNIDDFRYSQSSGVNYDLAQDLTDGVETSIKTMFTYTYEAGSTENARYTYLSYTRRNSGINDVTYLAEFTTFSIFEEIDGFSIDDYIDASKEDIIQAVHAKGYAKKDYVDQKVDAISNNTSKLSPNDFNPKYDVEMGLSGGQSLNVGTGASDNTTDWKNTVTFRKGSSLYNRYFTTEEQKNNFFGTEFVSIQNNPTYEGYPPLTASLNTALSLLESENNVDTSTFGFQFIPLVWGVSGSSITTMKKGTTPYADMIECVTKAKEFANKEGKTFGVTFMNWYHGESDINETKLWYYTEMSQLFIDINTDVKAITGQTEDIEFFTYQTNPWLGRDTPNKDNINIQEAQVQVVRDFANVHLCGAMYQFQYNDFYHPSDRAIVGLQTGVAIKRVVYDNETWNDFIPLSHNVISDGTNFYTHLKFGVPTKPMRFDVSGDIWHNENGKQPNFGFEVLDSGVEQQIAEPFIVRGDTVVLTTSSDPTGMTIRYAVNGSEGGGNLCDSQNIIVNNKNVNYVVDNFAGAFSEYLID